MKMNTKNMERAVFFIFIVILFSGILTVRCYDKQSAAGTGVGAVGERGGAAGKGVRWEYGVSGRKSGTPVAVSDLSPLQVKTLKSLKKIDQYPLYVLEYFGEYNFDNFLKTGLNLKKLREIAEKENMFQEACSTFSALNLKGDAIFGHNIDGPGFPTLFLFTDPPGSYASVSVVNIHFLGYRRGFRLDSLEDRVKLLEAPYSPHGGMNECGVAMAEMTIRGNWIKKDPGKVTINALHSIRLVLDHAKNVDEAVALLKKYNNVSSGGIHYLIADAGGKSVVVEYAGNKMVVISNTEPWQVATNFFFHGTPPGETLQRCSRYNTAFKTLKSANGRITRKKAMKLLKRIHQSFLTHWSSVYDLTTGDIDVVVDKKYGNVHHFKLNMRSD